MSKKELKCQHTPGNVYETQQGKVFKMINVKEVQLQEISNHNLKCKICLSITLNVKFSLKMSHKNLKMSKHDINECQKCENFN